MVYKIANHDISHGFIKKIHILYSTDYNILINAITNHVTIYDI